MRKCTEPCHSALLSCEQDMETSLSFFHSIATVQKYTNHSNGYRQVTACCIEDDLAPSYHLAISLQAPGSTHEKETMANVNPGHLEQMFGVVGTPLSSGSSFNLCNNAIYP